MILTAEVALSSCHVLLSKTNVIVCGSDAIDRLCAIYMDSEAFTTKKHSQRELYYVSYYIRYFVSKPI